MKSGVYLYLNSIIQPEKNYVLDNGGTGKYIEQYLATLDSVSFADVQYIKHALSLSIKLDLAQTGLNFNESFDYNYCKIINYDDGGNEKTCYYFIINKIWKSVSTIELVLAMDTLNTFEYNKDYEVNPKTLITREHKDRFYADAVTTKTIIVTQTIETGLLLGNQDYVEFKLYLPDFSLISNSEEYEWSDTSGQSNIGWTISGGSWNSTTHILTLEVDAHGATYPINCLLTMSFAITGVNNIFQRKIDKFYENINPSLFMKDLGKLLDKDGGEHWYLIYKNANAVVVNPDDSEVKAVNPVQILMCKDTQYSKKSTSLSSVRLYASNIQKIANTREYVMFRYRDLTASQLLLGTPTIEVNGTTYTLVPEGSEDPSLDKYSMIIYERVYNKDVVGKVTLCTHRNISGADNTFNAISSINSVAYIDITNCINAPIFTENELVWESGIINLYSDIYTHSQYIGSGTDTEAQTAYSIKDVDRTDSTIIKIIELPYAPLEFLDGITELGDIPSYLVWNTAQHMLELKTTNMFQFDYFKQFELNPYSNLFTTISGHKNSARNNNFESKIFNSEYYYTKFVYAGYGFSFKLELMDKDAYEYGDVFFVEYAVSQSCQSKFLFKFSQYTCTDYSIQDYNDVLMVNLNNELALYNNSYINYIKNGLAYDTQMKNMNNTMRALGTGLAIAGATLAFAISPVVAPGLVLAGGAMLGASAFGQTMNAVMSADASEKQLQQKQYSLSRQAESVSQVEDVDLLNVYSGNKAKLVEYKVSELMKQKLYNLFYYFGYATQENGIPNKSSRYRFNFVQCDMVITHSINLTQEIENDIIEKFKQGVTFFHNTPYGIDFAQEKENWEISLISYIPNPA